jgi:hypothetical protein
MIASMTQRRMKEKITILRLVACKAGSLEDLMHIGVVVKEGPNLEEGMGYPTLAERYFHVSPNVPDRHIKFAILWVTMQPLGRKIS